MLIDWYTVGAQALNFLILVWLMRRFLYKPILAAIDTREKKIAAELADADTKRAEAKKDRDEFQQKNAEFDQQRAALLAKATDEANAERRRLLDEARKAADDLSVKRSEALSNEAKNLKKAIARRTQEEVFSIARKTLTDLATTSLEERMGEVFTRRLREMNGQAKEALGTALKTAPQPAVVRSAFDLTAEERAKIQNAINETFSADVPLRFETAPDLVSGVELTSNGQKVAWSISDYLTSLEKGVGALLKQQEQSDPKPVVIPEAKVEPKLDPKQAAPTPATSELNREPSPKIEVDKKPKPEPETEPKGAVKPDAKPSSKPGADVDSAAELRVSSGPAAKPDHEVALKAVTETKRKTEAGPDAVPAPMAKAKPVAKAIEGASTSPENEGAAKFDAGAVAKPETVLPAPVKS